MRFPCIVALKRGDEPYPNIGAEQERCPTRQKPTGYQEEVLEAAKVWVYNEKRPKVFFLCLGNRRLPLAQRIHPFRTLGDLSKHFGRKQLTRIKSGKAISCKSL